MPKESKVRKDRTCKSCKRLFVTDAKGLVEHALTCKRLGDLGLIMPGGIDRI